MILIRFPCKSRLLGMVIRLRFGGNLLGWLNGLCRFRMMCKGRLISNLLVWAPLGPLGGRRGNVNVSIVAVLIRAVAW